MKDSNKRQNNQEWVGGKKVYGLPEPTQQTENNEDDWVNQDFGFDDIRSNRTVEPQQEDSSNS